jgi:hypothetical protein
LGALDEIVLWTNARHGRYQRAMSITATIMNSATGEPIQKMTFGRMPKPWASFHLENGERVTADRVNVGKPAPGKFIAPVEIWVTPKG